MQNLIVTLDDGKKASLVIPDGEHGQKVIAKMVERFEKKTPAPPECTPKDPMTIKGLRQPRRRSDAGIHACWLKCGPCPQRKVNAQGWSMCGACNCTASLEHQILAANTKCHLPEPLWNREIPTEPKGV